MSALQWGKGPPMYDLGVDRGVLYLDGTAVPWNGIVSVEEKESGGLHTEYYFEGNRLHISEENGDFEARISAYTYPEVFAEYNGYSEEHTYRRFDLSYRTQYGEGERLHLVYNALVHDDVREWKTESSRPDPSLFTWDISATPVPVPGASPSARLVLSVPKDPYSLRLIEDILYGTETTEPRLPSPGEVLEIYEAATTLRITYHGDGSYTASGPDSMVADLGDGVFEIDSPSVHILEPGLFTVTSYRGG